MRTLVLLALMLCAGCGRHLILAVPAISMTTPSLPPGTTASPGGRVQAEYCKGDPPLVSKDDNVGMIDEAVAKAQQQSGARYLSDVTISGDDGCIYVDGVAMR
jgi:hypothetical protein